MKGIRIPLKSKNDYLSEFFVSRELKEALSKVEPEDLREDLRQEIFVILCSKPEDEIIQICERGEIGLYAYRIMWTQIRSSTSPFYTKFRKPLENRQEFTDIKDIPDEVFDEIAHEQFFTNIVKGISKLSWYEQGIFEELVLTGSCAQVSRNTLIPKRSIYRTVKETREKLKKIQ